VEPDTATDPDGAPKRQLDALSMSEDGEEDEAAQKRRRIEVLEQYRDIDADDSSSSESSDDE
jgi:protein CWC15